MAQKIELTYVPTRTNIGPLVEWGYVAAGALQIFKVAMQPIEAIMPYVATRHTIVHWIVSQAVLHGEVVVDMITEISSVDGLDAAIHLIQDVPAISWGFWEAKKTVIFFQDQLVFQHLVQRRQPSPAEAVVMHSYIDRECMIAQTISEVYLNLIQWHATTPICLDPVP